MVKSLFGGPLSTRVASADVIEYRPEPPAPVKSVRPSDNTHADKRGPRVVAAPAPIVDPQLLKKRKLNSDLAAFDDLNDNTPGPAVKKSAPALQPPPRAGDPAAVRGGGRVGVNPTSIAGQNSTARPSTASSHRLASATASHSQAAPGTAKGSGTLSKAVRLNGKPAGGGPASQVKPPQPSTLKRATAAPSAGATLHPQRRPGVSQQPPPAQQPSRGTQAPPRLPAGQQAGRAAARPGHLAAPSLNQHGAFRPGGADPTGSGTARPIVRTTGPLSGAGGRAGVAGRGNGWQASRPTSAQDRSRPGAPRRHDEDEDDEDDGFIVDDDEEEVDWRSELRAMTRYDPSKFKDELFDDRRMLAGWRETQAEERRSERLGRCEDEQEEMLERKRKESKALRR